MTDQYKPSTEVNALAGKLSRAMADCLREADATPSENLEAALLCCAMMSLTTHLPKTADELIGMAGAVSSLREAAPTAGLLDPQGKPLQ